MIEIEEALNLVASHCQSLAAVDTSLEQLAGHVLAENVNSDVDSPPFDKSMMDGYAVKAADVVNGKAELEIVARITAGSQFNGVVHEGQAVQIMTGAPLPAGPDAVVMVEQTSSDGAQVVINAEVKTGQNILTRGIAMQAGQPVMAEGDFVRAEDIGLLAEAGAAQCQVIPQPTLAVIATGDELIEAHLKPTGSQIRNSNGPMIESLAKPYCSLVVNLGIGADEPESLAAAIDLGLRQDVLVLSGGVSAGVADLVPGLLQQAGVQQVFHKVKIKPGKPIWFGTLTDDSGKRTLVFGLPGNPVSSMVCFRVFVAPALLRLAGRDPQCEYACGQLSSEHSHRPGRTTYWPSKMTSGASGLEITPLNWKGSADLKTLVQANCFAVFPGNREQYAQGETVHVFPMG